MLASRTDQISPFYVVQVLKQANTMAESGRDVIRLFIGEPDFDAPAEIEAAAKHSLEHHTQGYTSSTGIAELKNQIAERYRRWHGVDLDPQRVIVTPGGSAALHVAFLATLNPDDEVLLPEPGYPCNANILHMVDARGVAVNLDPEHGMALSISALEAAVTEKTKAVLIASPSNPLGSVMSSEDWQNVVDFCQKHDLHLIADEIYQGLTFDGLAPTLLETTQEGWVIQSFSKFYGMTGWRLGWLVAPENAINACERIAQNLYLSAPALSQQAALAGFEPAVEKLCFDRVEELKHRRDYLMKALPELGLPVMANPDGAFYLYVDISKYSEDALTFCHDLLQQTGVAITPGIDFGGPCPDTSVRLAYTVGVERLEQAVSRLQAFLESYKQ